MSHTRHPTPTSTGQRQICGACHEEKVSSLELDLADALSVIGALCEQVELHPPPSFMWASDRWKKADVKMARLMKKYPKGIQLKEKP